MKRSRMFLLGAVITALLGSSAAHAADSNGFVSLFNGKDLTGWKQKNGTAKYTVEDGAIVGRTSPGSPNSFLTSAKSYHDFELQFDVKVDDGLNSGVQIRSQTIGGTDEGRVNGPQIEIESGPAQAGFIYGEATGRGWLTPDADNTKHEKFKNGEWNHFRVVAEGPHFQVWINGEQVSDLTDKEIYKTHPVGFLALQVHGIKDGSGPYEVRWKDIKIKELNTDKPAPEFNAFTPEVAPKKKAAAAKGKNKNKNTNKKKKKTPAE